MTVIWEMSDKETIVMTEPVIAQKEPYAVELKACETYCLVRPVGAAATSRFATARTR